MDKYKLRRKLIMQRESILLSQWQQNNNCIIKHIQSLSLFIQATIVLAYFISKYISRSLETIRMKIDQTGLLKQNEKSSKQDLV